MSHRKSAGRAQGHRASPELVLVPGRRRAGSKPAKAPLPPAGLLPETLAAWDTFHASPLALILSPVDDTALRTLFAFYDERARAFAAYRKCRYVQGSTGQPILNPIAKMILALTPLIQKLEATFGIGPRARVALGLAVGEVRKTLEDLTSELDEQDDTGPDPRIATHD